jgi:hypothetical protein
MGSSSACTCLPGDVPYAAPIPMEQRYLFRGEAYCLAPIGPGEPSRMVAREGFPGLAPSFRTDRWVLGLSVSTDSKPEDALGFYALAFSSNAERFDDTFVFVSPRARGRRLSHLLLYGVYTELLQRPGPFRLCEVIDHPRLRLHARCGFAPPVRPLIDGKVEVGKQDLHAVLSRLESEDEIQELLLRSS